jgi:molybdenum cofactor cytidylyltransferase
MDFAAVILAAGASSRMGRPKLLLPWRGRTVLAHIVDAWQVAGARQIAIVCAAENSALLAELDRIGVKAAERIINPEPSRGMFSSIQCAAHWAGWAEGTTHWAITLGDQPHVEVATLRGVIEHAARNRDSIVQPSYQGRARHPVILPKADWQELAGATEATLKEFLMARQARRSLIEIADPALDCDIDTPADYEEAVRRFGG